MITPAQLRGLRYYHAIERGGDPAGISVGARPRWNVRRKLFDLDLIEREEGVVKLKLTSKGKCLLASVPSIPTRKQTRMVNSEQRRARVMDAVSAKAQADATRSYPGSAAQIDVRAARYAHVIGSFRKALLSCMADPRAFMDEFDPPG
jgi:hypothetical protein